MIVPMVLGVPSGTGDPDCYPNLDFGGENCPRSPDNGISEAFERRDSEGDNCGSNPIPWYGGEAGPELPDVSGCEETTASITAIVVKWGRGQNFKPVRYGGSVGRVRFVCGCGGRMAGPRKVNPETAPSNTRRNITKYALPGKARCPFRLNYRWHAEDKCWSSTKFEPAHNHPPNSDDVAAFIHRTGDLTVQQRSFLASCVKTNMSPQHALHLYHELYPDAPPLTRQDVANLSDTRHVGSQDAHILLQMLLRNQQDDHEWFVRYKVDTDGKLTHLFWMSPRRHQNARDSFQLLIHDNTYKCNRFNLPMGVFSSVNRHGQTICIATALTSHENSVDYEWQYRMYFESVGICPVALFMDSDPGATAAGEAVFPMAVLIWCLWQILQNIVKNLAGPLGGEGTMSSLRASVAPRSKLDRRHSWECTASS
jgi:hypothetical protein